MSKPVYTALIGDVIGSRTHPGQAAMLDSVRETLERVNREVKAQQPLELTVGDEFQGLYGRLSDALRANLVLPLFLKIRTEIEVRVGLGQGGVEVLSEEKAPRGQSGPAWWLAREAIEQVGGLVKGWPAGTRSRFRGDDADQEGADQEGLVNAYLICQDQVLSRLDDIDARITIGLLAGDRQQDLAKAIGITQSTISSRQRFNGPAALVKAYRSLEGALST